jgi:toxin-antitoxin system PIN domain toxin
MNEALLDANTLIAAHDESHADHKRARTFVDGLKYFYTCPQTQGAFLRFFTRPWRDADGIERPPRLTTAEAMEQLAAVLHLKEHRFLADDFPFTKVSMRSLSGFKQWNDAYLIAKAVKENLKLATLERKLENMDNPAHTAVFRIA